MTTTQLFLGILRLGITISTQNYSSKVVAGGGEFLTSTAHRRIIQSCSINAPSPDRRNME